MSRSSVEYLRPKGGAKEEWVTRIGALRPVHGPYTEYFSGGIGVLLVSNDKGKISTSLSLCVPIHRKGSGVVTMRSRLTGDERGRSGIGCEVHR